MNVTVADDGIIKIAGCTLTGVVIVVDNVPKDLLVKISYTDSTSCLSDWSQVKVIKIEKSIKQQNSVH